MKWQRLLSDLGDAWRGVRRRLLRSILSSLGIGIGVTALIAMLSIGEGAKEQALARIRSLGTSTLRVESRYTGDLATRNLSQGLSEEDVAQVGAWLGQRGMVGGYRKQDDVLVQGRNHSRKVSVLGVNSSWFGAEKIRLSGGRLLDQVDIARSADLCVVGNALAAVFGVVVGDALLVGNLPVIVAGVMAPKGRLLTDGTGLSALDYDHALILPVSTMSAMSHSLHGRGFDGMVIALQENWAESIVSFGEQLQRILGEAHRRVNDFTVLVPVTLLRQVQESQRMFSLVMGAIAGLSLLVGGIGVMNVMLANIAEQTREIGLRMAIGASRRRIVQLYLCHSVILTAGGGAWGLGGGILLALIIEHYAGWQVGFSSISLVLAPASAIVTGVLFGVHPALQAARLQPAAALRET